LVGLHVRSQKSNDILPLDPPNRFLVSFGIEAIGVAIGVESGGDDGVHRLRRRSRMDLRDEPRSITLELLLREIGFAQHFRQKSDRLAPSARQNRVMKTKAAVIEGEGADGADLLKPAGEMGPITGGRPGVECLVRQIGETGRRGGRTPGDADTQRHQRRARVRCQKDANAVRELALLHDRRNERTIGGARRRMLSKRRVRRHRGPRRAGSYEARAR
jgi:hypothetical protein